MSILNIWAKTIDLYRFTCGGTVYTYSSKTEALHNGETYAPIGISNGDRCDSGDSSKNNLTITLPSSCEVAQLFRATGEPAVMVTIFERTLSTGATALKWQGRVLSVGGSGVARELTCESVYSSRTTASGPRVTRLCGRRHYKPGCNLNREDWAESATVTAISGRIVTVSLGTARDDKWFSAGLFEYGGTLRTIYAHSGNDLTLMTIPAGLVVGDAVTLYSGCDHLRTTCNEKFDNLLNCSAFAWIPTDNPFQGSVR